MPGPYGTSQYYINNRRQLGEKIVVKTAEQIWTKIDRRIQETVTWKLIKISERSAILVDLIGF